MGGRKPQECSCFEAHAKGHLPPALAIVCCSACGIQSTTAGKIFKNALSRSESSKLPTGETGSWLQQGRVRAGSQVNGDMKHWLLGSLSLVSSGSPEERLAAEIQASLASAGGNGC